MIPKLKEFIECRERETGNNVIRVRNDNAAEFLGCVLQDYFKYKGIKHERIVVGSPASNGLVERAHGTLLSLARANLAHSELPDVFWGLSIMHAAYVQNLVTSKALNESESPMQKWTGHTPNISHMRKFGCVAYFPLSPKDKTKFSPRDEAGILVGYDTSRRAYKVYDPRTSPVKNSLKTME